MKLNMVHAFPSPMMFMTLGEDSRKLNSSLMKDVTKILENNISGSRTGFGVKQTYGYLENQYESFDSLKTIVDNIIENGVMSAFGIEKFQTSNSNNFWLNSNSDKSAWHIPHTHNLADIISGVYFPSSGVQDGIELSESQDLDQEVLFKPGRPNDGDLIFIDPITARESMPIGVSVNKYPFYGSPLCLTPRAGTLIFFASWIPHMVAPTCKENFTRTSIAFAVSIKKPSA